MPKLDDPIHLNMYRESPRRMRGIRGLLRRVKRALSGRGPEENLYGYEWGHPDQVPPLGYVRDHYLLPYVDRDKVCLEIGPGGGRWTQYLLPARQLYLVDYHAELLDELRQSFNQPNMVFVRNNGTDFPGVPDESIDFLFSFGVFVHLDAELITAYLEAMRRILKPGADVVLQYADKTKIMARENPGFADNNPAQMRALVGSAGYEIWEEDLSSLWHSCIIRFGPPGGAPGV